MGLFKDLFDMGAHLEDDELFDLFVLEQMEQEKRKKKAQKEGKKYDDSEDIDPWKDL